VWRTTLEFSFAHAHLQCYEEELAGQRVDAVETRGKALLIRFEGGLSIYSHNQLYGRWYVRKHGSYPRTGRQLRLAIHTEKKSALLYSASDIAVLDAAGIRRAPVLAEARPRHPRSGAAPRAHREASPRRSLRRPAARIAAARPGLPRRQRQLSPQRDPLRRRPASAATAPNSSKTSQLQALARAVRSIARRTYKTGGITNDPQLVQRSQSPRRDAARSIATSSSLAAGQALPRLRH
jgi:endonuclease-8